MTVAWGSGGGNDSYFGGNLPAIPQSNGVRGGQLGSTSVQMVKIKMWCHFACVKKKIVTQKGKNCKILNWKY